MKIIKNITPCKTCFIALNSTILIILSVLRMFFSSCFYFPQLVLVLYHFNVGSPLELFVRLGFDLSLRPSYCNICGGGHYLQTRFLKPLC